MAAMTERVAEYANGLKGTVHRTTFVCHKVARRHAIIAVSINKEFIKKGRSLDLRRHFAQILSQ